MHITLPEFAEIHTIDTPHGTLVFHKGIERTAFDIDTDLVAQMVAAAKDARENAHAPYTKCKVGAALVMADDKSQEIITGVNVETAIAGVGSCAERTALFSAITKGYKKVFYVAVYPEDIHGSLSNRTPCGVCRQTLSEFSNAEEIVFFLASGEDSILADVMTMEQLMPCRYVIPK